MGIRLPSPIFFARTRASSFHSEIAPTRLMNTHRPQLYNRRAEKPLLPEGGRRSQRSRLPSPSNELSRSRPDVEMSANLLSLLARHTSETGKQARGGCGPRDPRREQPAA